MTQNAEPKLSAAETVRVNLEREISQGVLIPGDPLDEDTLAARFGVSRTPVREALLHLAALGIVTIAPRAGIYVSRLSIPELLGMLELLAELEAVCAKLATHRLTPEEGEALKRVHEESRAFVENGDVQSYARCNAEFHEILYKMCRNMPLATEIAHIRSRTQVYRQSVFQNQLRIRGSHEEHGRILEAVLAGDAPAASAAMLEHIKIGGRDFTDLILHLPTRLLAIDADYPGKQSQEQQRETSRRALARRERDATATKTNQTSSEAEAKPAKPKKR